MPHVVVKLWPGKSEDQKKRLAEAITKVVMNILHYGEESISVAMEEVKPKAWVEEVYKPDIKKQMEQPLQGARLRRCVHCVHVKD
jgi:4-oxalocrotonate tautomerase